MNYIQQKKHHKIILLHPTKTGGTTIKTSLNVLHKNHLPLNSWVIPKNSIVLTTIRNPYKRVVSMYNHFGHTMKNSFNEFLELLKKSNAVIFLPQHKYLHKKSNIIRLESIESDFNNFCEKHNIKSKLVTSNVSSKSLVKGLSKKQKELIHKRYKEDFDLLGYKK